jgi:hypothetical protein
MGKSFRECRKANFDNHSHLTGGANRANRAHHCQFDGSEDVILVDLAEVVITEATMAKLLARDGAQIEQLRQSYECGEEVVRVVLRPRFEGGYNVEDGRHRVIAAKQAGVGFIEAKLVG